MIVADTNIVSTFARIDAIGILRRHFKGARLDVTPATFHELRGAVRVGNAFLEPVLVTIAVGGDLTVRPPQGFTSAECVEMYFDLLDARQEVVLRALRRKLGPNGDMIGAFRQWWSAENEEHDRMMIQMLERLDRSLDRREARVPLDNDTLSG